MLEAQIETQAEAKGLTNFHLVTSHPKATWSLAIRCSICSAAWPCLVALIDENMMGISDLDQAVALSAGGTTLVF